MITPALPGDMHPELLRRCSPVVAPDDIETWNEGTIPATATGIVHTVGSDPECDNPGLGEVSIAWEGLHAEEPVSAGSVALDLRDATGRAHATWWLASRHESTAWLTPCVGESLWQYAAADSHPEGEGWPWSGWYLGDRFFCTEDGGEGIYVPRLADLNPEHPRLLPDNSRWVDAEALRLVCLHVAGL